MSNPFKKITANSQNSKSSLYSSGEKGIATSYTLACLNCGAPRPKNSNLATCDYCKSPFMNTNTVVKSDS